MHRILRWWTLACSALTLPLLLRGTGAQLWAQACGRTSATPQRILNSTDVLSLATTVECSDGGVVEVVWVGAVTPSAPVSVGPGTFLTITGEDAEAEVRGDSQSRMFEVSPGGGLTLMQLKLSGGMAENGGAIYSSMATVTLVSCVFDGNVATGGDGGAVWANGGNLTIIAGNFSRNNAGRNGGAVFTLDAGLVIQGITHFTVNKAVAGGAVYCGGAENTTTVTASCLLNGVMFESNNASSETLLDYRSVVSPPWTGHHGGGGAAFSFAHAIIVDSVFASNYAQISGAGVFGGNATEVVIDGCTFRNNTTPGVGAGVAACSGTLTGGTQLTDNLAGYHGAGVFGLDPTGKIEIGEVTCSHNAAGLDGGCFFAAGRSVVTEGTIMTGNVARHGGCIFATGGSTVNVEGGKYTQCQSAGNGGFLFAWDGAYVNVTGGTVMNNLARRRAGAAFFWDGFLAYDKANMSWRWPCVCAPGYIPTRQRQISQLYSTGKNCVINWRVYCSGDSDGLGGSRVTIEGGTFRDNHAMELGGAIAAWGTTSGGLTPTVVTITGGVFSNNTAKFYGGFIFLEELASLSCDGATIEYHYAGDQGGAIYARDATWVNSSCDLISNMAPQGAAAYLTYVQGVTLEHHHIADNVALGGSVVYAKESTVSAEGVSFLSGAQLCDDPCNGMAIELEGNAAFSCKECVFSGWTGDSVVYNANPSPASLVLDGCYFRESSPVMVVASPYSDAVVRNAIVCQHTIESAAAWNSSHGLVDRAVGCGESGICGSGQCVESVLGVLCECLQDGVCLNDTGTLSLSMKTPPPTVTYSPDVVYFELDVSAAGNSDAMTIWNIACTADELALQVFPSSGILPSRERMKVSVMGSPLRQDVGGNLPSSCAVETVGNSSFNSSVRAEIEVESTFYICQAFEYAMPSDDGVFTCEQCATIIGADGVDCELPGATLTSLPVKEGYWRSSRESLQILPCIQAKACVGGAQVSTSDGYCDDGYEGPYCAVCVTGYGRGASGTCHSCETAKCRAMLVAGFIFVLVIALFLIVAVVFLVGGLDAVVGIHRSMSRRLVVPNFSSPIRANSSPGATHASIRWNAITRWIDRTVAGGTEVRAGDEVVVGPPLEQEGTERESERRSSGGIEGHREAPPSLCRCRASSMSLRDGFGERIKRCASRLPMDKIKILVVVWQILTAFPTITGVVYPSFYARFLSWINVFNLDVRNIFVPSCALPGEMNFYHVLLLMTLVPIAMAATLVATYLIAKFNAGCGLVGAAKKRAAWSRHVAAGLLLSFVAFTPASTTVFMTFVCDEQAVEGKSFLRADYNVSCDTEKHMWYQVYAGIMILVYPVGIPVLYAFVLWKNRDSLNPRINDDDRVAGREGNSIKKRYAPRESADDLEKKLQRRKQNPDLVPSMFLWKDFDPHLYYFEVIECGRRILLTGVLVFIAPNTASQAAAACIFAFASLMGFELLRPHLDPVDSWLYRLGCVIIFLSDFLALLIRVDAAGEMNRAIFGVILVAVNVVLFLAVVVATWLSTQLAVDDIRDGRSAALAAVETVASFKGSTSSGVLYRGAS